MAVVAYGYDAVIQKCETGDYKFEPNLGSITRLSQKSKYGKREIDQGRNRCRNRDR